jgi:hypothetical protein
MPLKKADDFGEGIKEDEVYFTAFGRTLGAKLLRMPLNHKQREDWLAALVAWKSELDEYGDGDDLEPVCELVKNPQSIAGESRITTTLRLEWLEEQQRWDDALTVARQAQWWSRLALLQIGRQQFELAEKTITEHLDTLDATDCVTLVQALPESESVRALRLSKIFMPHVLRPRHVGGYVPYDEVHKLAAKVLELAQKHEDQPACREAREALLLAAPKLALWREHFAALDPSEHTAVRERLLQMLMGRGGGGHPEQLAILLEEKEWESAWSIASSGYNSVRHALPIAQKVVAHLPQPIRDYGLRIATPIITGNKSGEYEIAAAWLAVVRTAEIAMGRGRAWNERYETLLIENRRKYKLMPMLEELGRAPEDEAPPVAPAPPKERKPLIFKIN